MPGRREEGVGVVFVLGGQFVARPTLNPVLGEHQVVNRGQVVGRTIGKGYLLDRDVTCHDRITFVGKGREVNYNFLSWRYLVFNGQRRINGVASGVL